MVFFAAVVSFISFLLIVRHLSQKWLRRMVGHMWVPDLTVHGTVIWMFLGTSTLGLIQAELAAIMFSVWLRAYRKAFGYERFSLHGWKRFDGLATRLAR